MKANIKASIELTKSLIRAQAAPLFGLLGVSLILNLWGEDAMQAATPADETMRYSVQLGLGIWELVEGLILLLLLSWAVPRVHKIKAHDILAEPFATPYFGSFLAEYLRMLAQVLMWGLLFLIPGFVRYAQLMFVPYIALFSKRYRSGELDALEYSRRLAKGHLGVIIGILLFTMAAQAALEFLPQLVEPLHTFMFRVIFGALGFLISVWAYSVMFILFEDYVLSEEK